MLYQHTIQISSVSFHIQKSQEYFSQCPSQLLNLYLQAAIPRFSHSICLYVYVNSVLAILIRLEGGSKEEIFNIYIPVRDKRM